MKKTSITKNVKGTTKHSHQIVNKHQQLIEFPTEIFQFLQIKQTTHNIFFSKFLNKQTRID
jgi:hypothetical protein